MTDTAEETIPALADTYAAARSAMEKIRDLIAPTNTQIPWMRCAEIEIFIATEQQAFLRAYREIVESFGDSAPSYLGSEPTFPSKRPVVNFPIESNAVRFAFEDNYEFLSVMNEVLRMMAVKLEFMRKAVEGDGV